MLNVCGHNLKFLFVFSQLFLLFSIKTSHLTGLSFPGCHIFHKQGVSHSSSSMLRSWKITLCLLFPSHITSSRAYLPTNGLFHKYNKYKSHSLHDLQNNLVQRELEAKQYIWTYVFLKDWLTQLIDRSYIWPWSHIHPRSGILYSLIIH